MIKLMTSEEDIMATFTVMTQLRSHVAEDQYLETVKRLQRTNNYHLAAVIEDGRVRCVAGYRLAECLSWGYFLYVDDLVTDEDARSEQHGKRMMDWLIEQARENRCEQLHLDSGVQRHSAHRFYLRERMDITCYHFALKL
jgi:GNAT superfamily N-acetyltransferase